MYALIDCTSFYASCEKLFRPDLKHKPVVVLSNNDGCVVARSKEAKQLGIPMGIPYFQVRDFARANDVAVFSSNYALYQNISDRVMQVLESLVPELEVYSIDEAFARLDGLQSEPLKQLARKLYREPYRQVGVPVGVGIAPTKTLAKLANVIAKRMPVGICVLQTKAQCEQAMASFAIEDVWGVGRRLSLKLRALGIETALDLAHYPVKELQRRFSVVLAKTASELAGTPCFTEENPEHQKQIISSRMFGTKQTELAPMGEAIAEYTSKACERLRSRGLYTGSMAVFVSTGRHADKLYRNSAWTQFATPTNDTGLCIGRSKALLALLYKPGYYYAKVGVVLQDLCNQQNYQFSLFEPAGQYAKSERLMSTLDQVNRASRQVFYAAQGIEQQWQNKRRMQSPHYTTHVDDFPRV